MLIIAPYAQKLRNGKENPKNYAYWKELVQVIQKNEHIVQIGVEGETQLVDDFRKGLSLLELRDLLYESWIWIGVDSFFQHFAWKYNKQGIVLWSVSDPNIYGHDKHINLLKDRSYLAPNQFLWWENTPHNPDAFVKPEEVLKFL